MVASMARYLRSMRDTVPMRVPRVTVEAECPVCETRYDVEVAGGPKHIECEDCHRRIIVTPMGDGPAIVEALPEVLL